jgi:hypothetical protein
MSNTFEESGYFFDFSDCRAYKVDSSMYHDLPSVDFVVETNENYLFIEVKNPDNPKATADSRKEFLNDLKNAFYPYKARVKYTDTILRRWAVGETFDKPIVCIYILGFSDFSKTDRGKLCEKIRNLIPYSLNKEEFCGREVFSSETVFKVMSFEEFAAIYQDFSISRVH